MTLMDAGELDIYSLPKEVQPLPLKVSLPDHTHHSVCMQWSECCSLNAVPPGTSQNITSSALFFMKRATKQYVCRKIGTAPVGEFPRFYLIAVQEFEMATSEDLLRYSFRFTFFCE